MNWIKKLFGPKQHEFTRFTVYWSTSKVVDAGTISLDGWECETETIVITPHSEIYEAHSIEQAKAMHYSDHPDTQITSIMWLS